MIRPHSTSVYGAVDESLEGEDGTPSPKFDALQYADGDYSNLLLSGSSSYDTVDWDLGLDCYSSLLLEAEDDSTSSSYVSVPMPDYSTDSEATLLPVNDYNAVDDMTAVRGAEDDDDDDGENTAEKYDIKRKLTDCYAVHHHVACQCPQCRPYSECAVIYEPALTEPEEVQEATPRSPDQQSDQLPTDDIQALPQVRKLRKRKRNNMYTASVGGKPQSHAKKKFDLKRSAQAYRNRLLKSAAASGPKRDGSDDRGSKSQLSRAEMNAAAPPHVDAGPTPSPSESSLQVARMKRKPTIERSTRTVVRHIGPWFTPSYQIRYTSLLYDGVPIRLTAEAEEAAGLFSLKPPGKVDELFRRNFFEDFMPMFEASVLQLNAELSLAQPYDTSLFDFTPLKTCMKQHDASIRRAATLSKQQHAVAYIDGRACSVIGYELAGMQLIHTGPIRGRIRRRVNPEDVTINISCAEDDPQHAVEVATKHRWRNVVCDPYANWTAFWMEPLTNLICWSWVQPSDQNAADEQPPPATVSREAFLASIEKHHPYLTVFDDDELRDAASSHPSDSKLPLICHQNRYRFFDWIESALFVDGIEAMKRDVEACATHVTSPRVGPTPTFYFKHHPDELKQLKLLTATWMMYKFGFCISESADADGDGNGNGNGTIGCLQLRPSFVSLRNASQQLEVRVTTQRTPAPSALLGDDENTVITSFKDRDASCETIYKSINMLKYVVSATTVTTCTPSLEPGASGRLSYTPPLLFGGVAHDDIRNYILSFLPPTTLGFDLLPSVDLADVLRISNRNTMLATLLSSYSASLSFSSLGIPSIVGPSFNRVSIAALSAMHALCSVIHHCMSSFQGCPTYTRAMMDRSPYARTAANLRKAIKVSYARLVRLVDHKLLRTIESEYVLSPDRDRLVSNMSSLLVTICQLRIRLMNMHTMRLPHPWAEMDDRIISSFLKRHNLSVQWILPLLTRVRV